jgi:hypothetical protein
VLVLYGQTASQKTSCCAQTTCSGEIPSRAAAAAAAVVATPPPGPLLSLLSRSMQIQWPKSIPRASQTGSVPVSVGTFAKETPAYPGINPRSSVVQENLL